MIDSLISVIVPVYNASDYIDRCISSILNQTYRDLEVILVNDGSTDDSLEKCNKYCFKDQRVKVFTILNGGPSRARNFGMEKANGRYISFVDSDDELARDIYDVAIKRINEKKAQLLVFEWEIIDENGVAHSNIGDEGFINSLEYARLAIVDDPNHSAGGGYPWNKIIDRKKINNLEKFPENTSYYEDMVWTLRIAKEINQAYLLNKIGYRYFVKGSGLSKKKSIKKFRDAIISAGLIKKIICNDLKEKDVDYKLDSMILRSFWHLFKAKDYQFIKENWKYYKKEIKKGSLSRLVREFLSGLWSTKKKRK